MKISNELKAGALILFCIAILLVLTIRVGGIQLMKERYELKALFGSANGIKAHAPVNLAGVEGGEVKDLEIIYKGDETNVIMTLLLDKNAKVREDSLASIGTMGLMGEKLIEITRGSKGTPFLAAGKNVKTKEPLSMDEMVDRALVIADNLDKGISDLRGLTNNVNDTLISNRGDIDSIVENMRLTSENFRQFSEDVKKHPWKLIIKSKERKKKTKDKDVGAGNRGVL